MRMRNLFTTVCPVVLSLTVLVGSGAATGSDDDARMQHDGDGEELKLVTHPIAELIASDPLTNSFFGNAVAVSGNTAVVGAPGRYSAGAVYVFERNSSGADSWSQTKLITASDLSEQFGKAVAIWGDTIVVGDPYGPGGTVTEPDIGAVYVFERNQGGADNWGQVAKIVPADAVDGDSFGISLALWSDTLVVGSMYDDGNSSNTGSAYVFERNEGGADNWGRMTRIFSNDGAYSDNFGWRVDLDRDTIVVGARSADSNLGAAYLFERNAGGADSWGQTKKLIAGDAFFNERFGFSVAISGTTVAVGARLGRDGSEITGAAYLFERNAGGEDNWGQVRKLTVADAESYGEFGYSVSLDCDTLVVTARHGYYGDGSGAAHVFERNKGGAENWGQTTVLTAPVSTPWDFFGEGSSIDGNTIIAGATASDVAGVTDSGAAWVFGRTGPTWKQQAKVSGHDVGAYDYFSTSLDISGTTLLVGAERNGANGYNSGAAYVFERNLDGADSWGEMVKLSPSDAGSQKYFGEGSAICGDTAIVGSASLSSGFGAAYVFERNLGGPDHWGERTKLLPVDGSSDKLFGLKVGLHGDTAIVAAYYDSEAAQRAGAVYVFDRNAGGSDAWGQVAKLTASDADIGDYFGYELAIYGDTVVVGAPGNQDAGVLSGSAYVFKRNQGGPNGWGEVAKLTASDATSSDWFGNGVAVYDDTVAVGAPVYGRGVVYLFSRNEGGQEAWGQTHRITASGAPFPTRFGQALDLSCDNLLVGAWASDAIGSDSGLAYLFARNEGGADNWGQILRLQPADLESGDYFGSSVGLSCNSAAIGAYGNDDFVTNSGSAYVYRLVGPEADLSVSKSNGSTGVTPGFSTTYTIAVASAGPDDIEGAVVTDVVDPSVFDVPAVSWTCAPGSGAGPATSCPASGTAVDLESGVSIDLESGDMVVFTIAASLLSGASGIATNTVTVSAPEDADDPDPSNNSATDTDEIRLLDFGDAPDPSYPTLLANDGARHGVSGLALGYNVDGEPDGQPSAAADGDDNDGTNDDDGVHFVSALVPGERAHLEVWPNGVGVLDAWVDYNADGDWDDPNEHAITTQPLSTGWNPASFLIPGSATLGPTMARFRLSMTAGLGATGIAEVGEVEDYPVEISSVSVESVRTLTATARTNSVKLEWLNPYVGFYATMIRYRTDGFPTGPFDGTWINSTPTTGAGNKESFLHSNLAPGTTYYYSAYVTDSYGGYSTGKLVSARPQNSVPEVPWAYSTSASALAPVAPLPGEAYYAVSNDRHLHALESGQSGGSWPNLWKPPAMNGAAQGRGPVVALPTTTISGSSSVAFVGSQDGHVYAFDAERGTRLWISSALDGQVQAAPTAMFADYGAPFDLVVAATRNVGGDSKVYGLDPLTGSMIWSFDNGGGASGIGVISSQPSIDRSGPVPKLVFASRRHPTGSSDTVWCLELTQTSASLLWSVDIGEVDGSAIRWGDNLYVGNNAGEVHALDPDTGTAVWPAYTTGDGPVKGWIWVDTNASRMYFSTTGSVHAVTDNGPGVAPTPFWSPALSVSSPSCPLIIDGTLYVGAGDDSVLAIDSGSASPTPVPLVIGDPTADKTLGSPSFDVESGYMVIGSDQGRVFAVGVPFGGSP